MAALSCYQVTNQPQNINYRTYTVSNERNEVMKKDLPQLKIGRAIAHAAQIKKRADKTISVREFEVIKTLLNQFKPKEIGSMVGRSEFTIYSIKRSKSFYDYKNLIAQKNNKKVEKKQVEQKESERENKEDRQQHIFETNQRRMFALAEASVEREESVINWLRSIWIVVFVIAMVTVMILLDKVL